MCQPEKNVSTKQISTVNHRIQRRRKILKIAHLKTSLCSKFRCFLSFEIHEIPAYLEQKSTQKTKNMPRIHSMIASDE